MGSSGDLNVRACLAGTIAWLAIISVGQSADFELHSPTWHNGGVVPAESLLPDCGGKNLSPALSWSGIPNGTRSFAVTLFDPDAPGGKGWWHWVVFDLNAGLRGLPAGAGAAGGSGLEGGKQTRNDYGSDGYGGPCPPSGSSHRYLLTVTALNVSKLPVPPQAEPARVAGVLAQHALAKATITLRYGR
jgi:Raf kinase inhibitor-like YbhB/YbcL family protein